MSLEKISFSDKLEEWKNLPAPKERKIKQLWVKKLFKVKDWNFFSENSSYCFLKKEKEGVWAGFLVANPELPNGKLLYPAGVFPKDCLPITDDEAIQIDSYRRAVNVFPVPCEKYEM